MTLTQIVADREYCKRLEELGVKGDSLFNWVDYRGVGEDWDVRVGMDEDDLCRPHFPAWTAEEIGVMFGTEHEKYFQPYRNNRLWIIGYCESETCCHGTTYKFGHEIKDKKLVNSMAQMLIHLIEEEIITAEEVNKRLEEA